MGKKHKHPEHENLERWLVSYADFITLLFATFVVLYALSQADLSKFKKVSDSVKAAFNPAHSIMQNPGGVMKGTPDAKILPSSGNSILDKFSPKPAPQPTTSEGTVTPMADAVKDINKDIQKIEAGGSGKGKGDDVGQTQLKLQERGIVISFSSNLFFEPGSAGIKPNSFPILDKVCADLKSLNRIIHVEGHTDNQPIVTAVYPSNWELSTARASSVVRYFLKKGFDPTTLAAVGYGDTRPLAPNNTAAGRSKNRRVDIVILFSSAVSQADAGAAQQGETIVVRSSEDNGNGEVDTSPQKSILPAPIPPIVKGGQHIVKEAAKGMPTPKVGSSEKTPLKTPSTPLIKPIPFKPAAPKASGAAAKPAHKNRTVVIEASSDSKTPQAAPSENNKRPAHVSSPKH